MTEDSSILYLNGCTLSSSLTGMRLTTGTLVVNGQNYLYNQFNNIGATSVSQGIMFGNGNAGKDLDIEILPGGNLDLMSGVLAYADVN